MKSNPKQKKALTVICGVLTFGLVLWIALPDFPNFGEDSPEYRELMLNHWSLVHQPFSSRFLHPEVVALLIRGLGVSVQTAVVAVALVSLVLIVAGMGWILARLEAPTLLLLPVMIGFAFIETFRLVYMPDLFYTLLTVGLFLLLMGEHFLLSAILVFVMYCARESTLVLGVTLTVMSLIPVRLSRENGAPQVNKPIAVNGAVAFAVATVAGFFFNRYISSKSASNPHELGGLMYLVGKIPYNFLKNVLGVAPWTDTLVRSAGNHPLYQHPLPHWIHLGVIHSVGIADISARYPLRWLTNTLCTFGVLFTVVWRNIAVRISQARAAAIGPRRRLHEIVLGIRSSVLEEPFYSRVALLYGLVSLLIVPILGTAVHRYIYYAWAAFWITGVRLLVVNYLHGPAGRSTGRRIQLLTLHLAMLWLPLLVQEYDAQWWRLALLFVVAVVLQVVAWACLAKVAPVLPPASPWVGV